MANKQTDKLAVYTSNLFRSFAQWEYLYTYGGQDPFWPDGVNLNLVRNHIIYEKRQIEELLQDEQENTFFSTPYPDIYHRPTPDEVDSNYMARADEIRARANEQIALYQQDPNFLYIMDHYKEAFPNGETKAHKAAGIHPGMFTRFWRLHIDLESGNLVDLRRDFYKSYEENKEDLEQVAKKLQCFLEADHSKDDMTPVENTYDEDTGEAFEDEEFEEAEEELREPEVSPKANDSPAPKLSLDAQIQAAKNKTQEPGSNKENREEQLSLF